MGINNIFGTDWLALDNTQDREVRHEYGAKVLIFILRHLQFR